jgi:hypothetical protein
MDVLAERPTQREMDRWLRGEDVGPEVHARCRAATEHLAYKPCSPQNCIRCGKTREEAFSWTCHDCKVELALSLGPPSCQEWDDLCMMLQDRHELRLRLLSSLSWVCCGSYPPTRSEWDKVREIFMTDPDLSQWLTEVRSFSDCRLWD